MKDELSGSGEAISENPLNRSPVLTLTGSAAGMTGKRDIYTASVAVSGIARLLLVNSEVKESVEVSAGPHVAALDRHGENALLSALLICSEYIEDGISNLHYASEVAPLHEKKGVK